MTTAVTTNFPSGITKASLNLIEMKSGSKQVIMRSLQDALLSDKTMDLDEHDKHWIVKRPWTRWTLDELYTAGGIYVDWNWESVLKLQLVYCLSPTENLKNCCQEAQTRLNRKWLGITPICWARNPLVSIILIYNIFFFPPCDSLLQTRK